VEVSRAVLQHSGAIHDGINALQMRQPVFRPSCTRDIQLHKSIGWKAICSGTCTADDCNDGVIRFAQPRQHSRPDEAVRACQQYAHR
jgi:hypothetical protein